MPIVPNTNQRYQVADSSSVYNMKQSFNKFIEAFAQLEQKNLVDNNFFNYINPGPSGSPVNSLVFWDSSLVSSISYSEINKTMSANFGSEGYLKQNIQTKLLPNENYTIVLFSNAPASGIKLTVEAASGNQIYNLHDSMELNSATTTLDQSSDVQKHVLQFSTNATALEGDVWVKIVNTGSGAQVITFRHIMVYKGLIELAGLPYIGANNAFLDDINYDYEVQKWALRRGGSDDWGWIATEADLEDILAALEAAGVWVPSGLLPHKGQSFIDGATFEGSVVSGDAVYKNDDGNYYKAISNGLAESKYVGIADVSTSRVTSTGFLDTAYTGFANQANVYLSATVAGQLTTTETEIQVGMSLGNGVILFGSSTAGGTSGSSTTIITAEDSSYEFLLNSLPFNECWYNIFNKSINPVTLGGSPLPTWSSTDSSYSGSTGSTLTTIPVSGADTYYKFLNHLDKDDSLNVTSEYSLNGTNWIAFDLDEITTVSASGGYTVLYIKYTWVDSGKVYSTGTFYDDANTISLTSTETRISEILSLASSAASGAILTAPNGMSFTHNNKSLELFQNGQRLYAGVDYVELDNVRIQLLINAEAGDKFLFTEKFGYYDSSVDNQARLNLEHDLDGSHNFTATGILELPTGTTGNRPAATASRIRFNTDLNKAEIANGSTWGPVGGGATGGGSDEIFVENGQTITTNYTISTGKNALTTGPINIDDGVIVTIPDGSRWLIL